jgi:uncharacterized protein involved in exopolysaccharide biosynthesis
MESLEKQPVHSLTREISFKEILLGLINWIKFLLSNWLYLVVLMAAGGLYNFIQANRQPLKYIAVSTFVLQEAGASPGNTNSFSAILGLDVPDNSGIFQGDNLFELYRSRLMIKKALLSKVPDNNGYIIDRYLKINGFRQAWKDKAALKNIDFIAKLDKKHERVRDSLMAIFVNDINFNYLAVFRVGKLSIFRVEVRSTDEEFAKLFNDQIVKTVNEFYIETKTGQAIENLKLLQHQADSISYALNGAMRKVASSADVTINPNPARQILRVPSQRSQVEVDNNRQMLNELVRNLEVSKMSLRKETPLIRIIDEPVYPLDKFRDSRAKALAIGAALGGMLAAAFLSLRLLYKKILQ